MISTDVAGGIAFIRLGLGFVLGCWFVTAMHRADVDRLTVERDELREALADSYRALADPEETRRVSAKNLRRALRDEVYDQEAS